MSFPPAWASAIYFEKAKARSCDGYEISRAILDAAIAVDEELGPGLLESVYEVVLAYKLQQRGLNVNRQVPIAIRYKEMIFDEASRADCVVDKKVIVELKSLEQVREAHKKQVQTYLRLT